MDGRWAIAVGASAAGATAAASAASETVAGWAAQHGPVGALGVWGALSTYLMLSVLNPQRRGIGPRWTVLIAYSAGGLSMGLLASFVALVVGWEDGMRYSVALILGIGVEPAYRYAIPLAGTLVERAAGKLMKGSPP